MVTSPTTHTDNLTIGAGKLYLRRSDTLTGFINKNGFLYMGNTPAFTIARATTTISHYSADYAGQQKDREIVTRDDMTATVQFEDMNVDNMALFFGGGEKLVLEAAGAATTQEIGSASPGQYYLIGESAATPYGSRATAVSVSLTNGGAALAPEWWEYDVASGMIYFFLPSEIADGTSLGANSDVTVSYTPGANTRQIVIAKGAHVTGELMFVADNTLGENHNIIIPLVSITASGDMAFKGTGIQTGSLTMSVLKAGVLDSLYRVQQAT
ncbi:MAG: hypothetical protein ACRYGR_00525 [Janthinobacterium lividum]